MKPVSSERGDVRQAVRELLQADVDGESLVSAFEARSGTGQVADISAGGLLVRLKKPVLPGITLNVVVRPKDAEPLGLRGEVVRVRQAPGHQALYDIGLRLSSDASLALLALQPPKGNA